MSFNVITSGGMLHYCNDHTGKMQGMTSISTSVVKNPYCQKRQNVKNSVCAECFSESMHEQYSDLAKWTAINYDTLNGSVIPVNEFPLLNVSFFRDESFGDSASTNHGLNMINQCLRNPFTMFACWTKQFTIWDNVFKLASKPANLIMVASSPIVNRPLSEQILIKYPWIDHIFTVFTADFALENDITIQCGLSRCLNCLQCYRKDTPVYINEVLKNEQPYYYRARYAKNKMKIRKTPVVSVSPSEIAFFQGGKYHFYKVTTDPKYLYKINKRSVSEATGNAEKIALYLNSNIAAFDALMNGRIYKKGA